VGAWDLERKRKKGEKLAKIMTLTPNLPVDLSESLEQANDYLEGELTELFIHLNQFYFSYFQCFSLQPISPFTSPPIQTPHHC